MSDDTGLEITAEDISGPEAAERDAVEEVQAPPVTPAAPPVPGQQAQPGAAPPSSSEILASLSFEEKRSLLEEIEGKIAGLAATAEMLEEETTMMDGRGWVEHSLALIDEVTELLRPIRLGGELPDEKAPFNKLQELKQWMEQGLTLVAAAEEETAAAS